MRIFMAWVAILAFALTSFPPRAIAQEADENTQRPGWALAIHGGAGVIERDRLSPEQDAEIRAALAAALDAGSEVLANGGDAVDAVTAVITRLEDDPNFNAGKGAVFTWDGTNELDSSIMDGETRNAGAVAGVHATRHPILLARKVMEESPHVMLSGTGADAYSVEMGLEQVDPAYFRTERRWQQLQQLKEQEISAYEVESKHGTVGAVALDRDGHVAAGTSTGGLTGKRYGRIGDSPIIGAGTYADDRSCAVSATGAGEYFIRVGVAREICSQVRLEGAHPQSAADSVMAEVAELGGDGGVIYMTPAGDAGWSFNTPGMYRARASSLAAPEVRIYGDEE